MNLLVKHLSGDRRSARRYHIKVPLRYRLRRSTASEHTAESENLSELGVFFAADIELSVGAAIDLIVEMPTELSGVSSVQWLCTGHVVRIERSGRIESPPRLSRVLGRIRPPVTNELIDALQEVQVGFGLHVERCRAK